MLNAGGRRFSVSFDQPRISSNNGVYKSNAVSIAGRDCKPGDVTQGAEAAMEIHVEQPLSHWHIQHHKPAAPARGPRHIVDVAESREYYIAVFGGTVWLQFDHPDTRLAIVLDGDCYFFAIG